MRPVESIRQLNRAVPFLPYEIHTKSGQSYLVKHPDFVCVSPKESFVVFVDTKDRPHHLNAEMIETAVVCQRRRRS
jgi:hypothetical protein